MKQLKLDILAISVHPDDIELCCAGTLLRHIDEGKKVGILDLTRGELGTRGTAETRAVEAAKAAKIMKIHARENLGMADGFFEHNEINSRKIINAIRHYQPDVVLANALHDRHPDHGRAGKLTADACFLSGLRRIATKRDGLQQEAWRPRVVYHYIQDYITKPDFVVDITPYYKRKLEAIFAYSTQFYNPDSSEPDTPISGAEFIEFLKGRAMEMGRHSGVTYAEGFTVGRPPVVSSFFDIA